MHIAYQLSNILESVATVQDTEIGALYLCHNSIFDIFLSYCNIDLNSYDPNNKKFLDGNKIISSWSTDSIIKPYSAHIVNSPLNYLKNNNSLHFHLNSVVFAHDVNLLSIKKEDAFLLCNNAFRPNDTMVYFNSIMSNYNCPKITSVKCSYSVPNELVDTEKEKNGSAIFCYNKTLGQDLLVNIGQGADQLFSLPNSIEELNEVLNKYELFIELDPGSIINCLAAIACGGVAIILDPNNVLLEYKNIPNLYIVNSLPELAETISQKPKRVSETTLFDSRFRNFDNFKETIIAIIKTSQRKAFVL